MDIRPPAQRLVRHVRMRDTEWQLVRLAASERESRPSTWLRELAVREARRQLNEVPAADDRA